MALTVVGVEIVRSEFEDSAEAILSLGDVAAEVGDCGDFAAEFEVVLCAVSNLFFAAVGFGDEEGLEYGDVAGSACLCDGCLRSRITGCSFGASTRDRVRKVSFE